MKNDLKKVFSEHIEDSESAVIATVAVSALLFSAALVTSNWFLDAIAFTALVTAIRFAYRFLQSQTEEVDGKKYFPLDSIEVILSSMTLVLEALALLYILGNFVLGF